MKLNEPTAVCKICFNEFKRRSPRTLFGSNVYVCPNCYKKLKPRFYSHKIDGVKALTIYEYDDEMKSLIYKLKGCYDIELAQIFIPHFVNLLRFCYRGYYLVPAPSSKVDDIKRGFNHVEELFRVLHLPFLKIITKIDEYKQSDHHAKDRYLIDKHLKVSDLNSVKNKKILIVDDICTTGSTLKAMVNIIRMGNPRTIKILTIAMTKVH